MLPISLELKIYVKNYMLGAFENCQKIEKIAQTHDEKTGRFDEIALPLRVIGSMISEECCKELK